MLRIAVLGCGRIGQMHAANIGRHARTSLPMVYDILKDIVEGKQVDDPIYTGLDVCDNENHASCLAQ